MTSLCFNKLYNQEDLVQKLLNINHVDIVLFSTNDVLLLSYDKTILFDMPYKKHIIDDTEYIQLYTTEENRFIMFCNENFDL